MVIWIVGLSGAGKTFAAKYLKKQMQAKYKKKIIHVDGDQFRNITSNDLGYDLKNRKTNSLRIQNFCKYLEEEGFIVICSILSIFSEHRKKNRKIFKKYKEIFINCSIESILNRDKRRIYKKKTNVVGKHFKFIPPKTSDHIINNDGSKKKLFSSLDKLLKKI